MSSEHLGRRRHAPLYVQLPLQSSLEDPCCGDQLVPLACGVVMQVLACQGGSPGTLRALCDTVCRQAGLGQFMYMCVYIFSSPHWIAVNTCDPDDTEGQHQARVHRSRRLHETRVLDSWSTSRHAGRVGPASRTAPQYILCRWAARWVDLNGAPVHGAWRQAARGLGWLSPQLGYCRNSRAL